MASERIDLPLQHLDPPFVGTDLLLGGDPHRAKNFLNIFLDGMGDFMLRLDHLGDRIGEPLLADQFVEGCGFEDLTDDVVLQTFPASDRIIDDFFQHKKSPRQTTAPGLVESRKSVNREKSLSFS